MTVSDPTPTTVTVSYTGCTRVFRIGVGLETAVVHRTGNYYPPYVCYPPHNAYPVYWPYHDTYAVGARYNAYTGGHAVGRAAYGP